MAGSSNKERVGLDASAVSASYAQKEHRPHLPCCPYRDRCRASGWLAWDQVNLRGTEPRGCRTDTQSCYT